MHDVSWKLSIKIQIYLLSLVCISDLISNRAPCLPSQASPVNNGDTKSLTSRKVTIEGR